MAQSSFDQAFEIVVGIEGKYVNDPADPGGETKYGIAKRWHKDIDIKNLTLEGAKEIYQREYWNAAHCDRNPWPMSLYLFDAAVQHSPADAVKMLALVAAKASGKELEHLFLAERALYYATHSQPKYDLGHFKRLFVLQTEGSKS